MTEPVTAKLLVTATGGHTSVVVGVASADEALAEMRQLRAEGLTTVVFDRSGLDCTIEVLQADGMPARNQP